MKEFFDASLKPYNTFGIEAKAKAIFEIEDFSDIQVFLTSRWSKQSFIVLGQGSNVLFTKDYLGAVLIMNTKGIEIVKDDIDTVELKVQAGEIWDDFVRYCIGNHYLGLENLALIPGKVGSAPVQNIGAYGREVKDFIKEVHAVKVASGQEYTFSNSQCNFNYRNSAFKNIFKGQYIITSVSFILSKTAKPTLDYKELKEQFANDDTVDAKKIYDYICQVRKLKLPEVTEFGNAGSFFKNPVVDYEQFATLYQKYPQLIAYRTDEGHCKLSAAQLIEICKWKGKRSGNVGVHEKHALVLVNYGKAMGYDVVQLAKAIQNDVFINFGVCLEIEVNLI